MKVRVGNRRITVFICAMMLFIYQGVAYGDSKKTSGVPTLKETKTFLIYAKKGNTKVFDSSEAKLVEDKKVKDFQNGELLFIITGPNSAILSSNRGAAEVKLVKDHKTVTFIGTSPKWDQFAQTSKQKDANIIIVKDEWDVKGGGFPFTYTHNFDGIFLTFLSPSDAHPFKLSDFDHPLVSHFGGISGW